MTSESGGPFGTQQFPQSSSVPPGMSTNAFKASSYFNSSLESSSKNPFAFVNAAAPIQQPGSLPGYNPIGPNASLSSDYPQQGHVSPWSYPSGSTSEPSSLQLVKNEPAVAGDVSGYSNQPPPMSFGEHTSTLQDQRNVPAFPEGSMSNNLTNASQPFNQQHTQDNAFGFPPYPLSNASPPLGHRQSMPAIPVASTLFAGNEAEGNDFFSSLPLQSLPAQLRPRPVSQPVGSFSAPSTSVHKSLSPELGGSEHGDMRSSYSELQSGVEAKSSCELISGMPVQSEEVRHQLYPSDQQLGRNYLTNATNADFHQPQSGKSQTNSYHSHHDTPVPTSLNRDNEPQLSSQHDQGPQPWEEELFSIVDQNASGRIPHLDQALEKPKGGFGKYLDLGAIADLVNLSNGESVEVPSLSSSLDHSVSSLLDSQEDFTQISPCKILPPTPENVLYAAVTPPIASNAFPLTHKETTIPSEHQVGYTQPLTILASTEKQDLPTFVHSIPDDERHSNAHIETETQSSNTSLPQLAPTDATQVAHHLPQQAPSDATQVAPSLPQLASSDTTQVAPSLPQLASSDTMQVAHHLPQLPPSDTTQVSHSLPQLAHPLPQLAPSDTTQVAPSLPQLASSDTIQLTHPLPQQAPSDTTQVAHLPTGLPQSDMSQLLGVNPPPPASSHIYSQSYTFATQPPTIAAPPPQEVQLMAAPDTGTTLPQQENSAIAGHTVPQPTTATAGEVVTQPLVALNPTHLQEQLPQVEPQLATVQATHHDTTRSVEATHLLQPNMPPPTSHYQLPTEHHTSTTVQKTPMVESLYTTLPSTVPTTTGVVSEGVPAPNPLTHLPPAASIAPVSQPQPLPASGLPQSAHMPHLIPAVVTTPSQSSLRSDSLVHTHPSVTSVSPSVSLQAIPTSSPPQEVLPPNPPPMGTATSTQAIVHPDTCIQATTPSASFPPQREASSGGKDQSLPTATHQDLTLSHPQFQPSGLQEPTPTSSSQPGVTQEGNRYVHPPSARELDHSHDRRGRYEGHPVERGRHEGHPDERGRHEGHPDERGRHEGHPDERRRYEGHPDERGRYEAHPDERGRYEGHPSERGRYESHPDDRRGRYEGYPDGRGSYEGHLDSRGRYMYEDPRGYYRTEDPYNRQREDDYYRHERSIHPSYHDQDPYSRDYRHRPDQDYHHRPNSRHPYDYYGEYRHEYGHERRQYDYGRYAYEDDYYGYHRTNPYHDREGSHYYDDRYYDPQYDSQYARYHHYDQWDPEGQHGYEYPDGGGGYDDQYNTQDGHYAHDYNQQSTTDPEASVIYGKPTDQHFEISQMFDSPNTRLPRHPEHLQHESTAYPEQLSYYGGDYTNDPHYKQQSYYDGGYGTEEPAWAPVEVTPPPPARETPELFVQPHVRASFGIGGQLVTILPNNPRARETATVEISSLKDVVKDPSMCEFVEAVNASPGPFIPGDTPKSEVIKFAATEAEKCRQKSQVKENEPEYKNLEDEALLWDFLVLLCQQNGVVVPSDVAELLMKGQAVTVNSSTHIGGSDNREGSLEAFRQLLLAGRKKDALDQACARSLWGHALMLASGMDEQSRTYVVNRFTASLMVTDPLNTFYTLMLGRTPSAVKPEGLSRAGDWRSHLAMILSNRTSRLDNSCIVTLGDSLLSQGRLNAAHLCYHLAQVQFGLYGETDSKYTLLGVEHSHLKVGTYPKPHELHKMEVFEYAMSLGKKDFSLPHFQMFKLLHVLKLKEAGFKEKGFKYCEQISSSVANTPRVFTPTFLLQLMEVSANLHHITCPLGVMENELPSWLLSLQQSVREALSSDYTPSLASSPSPAFSSVSQTYGNQQFSQPIIGLGQYLAIPSSLRGSTAASSREGSTADFQVAVPRVDGSGHQLETQTASQQHTAETDAQEMVIPDGENGGVAPQQSQDAFALTQNQGFDGSGDMQQYIPQTQSMEGAQQTSYQYQPFLQQQDVNQAQTSEPGTETATDSQPAYGSYVDYGMTSEADSGGAQGDAATANTNTQMTYYGVQPSGSFMAEGIQTQSHISSQFTTNEQQDQHQEETEHDTAVAKQPLSGDDHVTNEKPEKEPEDEKPPEKKEPAKKPAKKESSGSRWSFNILKYVLPRRKNEAFLPDDNDNDKRIIWDEEKKTWVDLDAPAKEESTLAAPPTDADLKKQGGDSTDGPRTSTGEEGPPSETSAGTNIYSRQSRMKGRLGVRSKYVDVLNPGGTTSGAPPPPAPLMMSAMPGMPTQPFSGTFFVPQPSGTGSTFKSEYGAPSTDGENVQETTENSTTASGTEQDNIQSDRPNQQLYDQSTQFGQPSQQPYDQSDHQPYDQSNQQPYDQSNQFGQQSQQSYDQSNQFGQQSQQPYDQSNQQPYDQSNQQPYDQSNQFGQPSQQPYDQSNQQPYDQSSQQAYDQSNQFGQPNQQPYDQSNQFGQPSQQPYDQSNQQAYDQSNQFGQPSQQAYDQFGQPSTQGMMTASEQTYQFGEQQQQQQTLSQQQETPVSAMTIPSSVPSPVPKQESKQQRRQRRQQKQKQKQKQQQKQQEQQATSSDDNPPPPQQPQFFNPSAFAPMSTFPQALGPGSNPIGGHGSTPSSDSHDDALSTVSAMSELSQEVSRYMSNQRPPTVSAGYSRLRQGIRGAKGTYPVMQQRSGQPAGGPPPASSAAPPPPRNTIYQQQHWQQQ